MNPKRTFKESVLLHLLWIAGISIFFLWMIPVFHFFTGILAFGVVYYFYRKEKQSSFGSNPYRPKR